MLKGEKVILRPVEERDLELIARWRNAPENRQYFFTPFLINPAGQKAWYERLLNDPTRVLMMIDTIEGKTVGMVGLSDIDWRNQACEGGQYLVDPEERGHGYAEEAAMLTIQYAFEELNLRRMYIICYAFNPVRNFVKFLGFREEGVLRQAVYSDGQFHDKVVLALLREEWEDGSFGYSDGD
jgi:RimJ/RimL family protein N-acetyltransferase